MRFLPSNARFPALGAAIAMTVTLALRPAAPFLEAWPHDLLMRLWASSDRALTSRVHVGRLPGDQATWPDLLRQIGRTRPAAVLLDADVSAPSDALVRAMHRVGRVVIPTFPAPPDSARRPHGESPPARSEISIYGDPGVFPALGALASPDAAFLDAAERVGAAFFGPAGGVARSIPLAVRIGDTIVATLPLACVLVAYGESSLLLENGGDRLDSFGGRTCPLDRGASRPRYPGPRETFRIASADALVEAAAAGDVSRAWPGGLEAGDLVLLETEDAPTLRTPTDPAMSRAEVIAAAVDGLLRADGMRRVPAWIEVPLTALFGALLGAALMIAGPLRRRATAGVVIAPLVLATLTFGLGRIVSVTGPLLALAVVAYTLDRLAKKKRAADSPERVAALEP